MTQKRNKKIKINIPSKKERTLVLIKPDGVKRGLIGEILARFERVGFKIVGLKIVRPTREHFDQHYPSSPAFLKQLGTKAIQGFRDFNMEVKKEIGTTNKLEIGKIVKRWLVDYMTTGPVVAVVIQGPHAVENVRMMVGPTAPLAAPPGTIRGDFSVDSASLANPAKRSVKNMIHASGDLKEAEEEIKLWFAAEEINDYKRADEDIIF